MLLAVILTVIGLHIYDDARAGHGLG